MRNRSMMYQSYASPTGPAWYHIAPIEIHRQLCQVYGPNIMCKQMVRRWYRQFSEGRQSVHVEERSGRPSLINDDRVELVRQCIMENRRFTNGAEQPFSAYIAILVPPGASSVAAVVRNRSSYSFSAACEVRSVIKFFNAQSIAPIEIHRQLCQVYGPNIMSKQMVRCWCRQFSEGRQSVHVEDRSGRPSLINDDRVELVRQCIMENRRFTNGAEQPFSADIAILVA
ncbi:hypothetical protein ANN_11666 [Periplaneta americana]|uniref:Mos1 transposase HTH domain-containing protein n=1 Tax=Periplaneta americana TaxID=6978 RepID=A0ABQ8T5N3_PERAM|nr:hypothetical protein ANN_11666 [Periplaneta americana]